MALNGQLSNLPPEAQAWVREVEKALLELVRKDQQKETQIVALKKRVK